jgi:hypothetical protein
VRLGARDIREAALLWFAVLGAPAAWTVQHVFGFGLTVAACNAGGRPWGIDVDTVTLAVTIGAAVVAAAAEAAALVVFRATRDEGSEPPGSRIHFMSVVGLTINPLFLCIILLSGIGVSILDNCVPA